MKKIVILLLGCTLATGLLAAVQDRETHQADLDRACANAQQQLVAESRQQNIDACIEQGGKAAKCQQEYANFGQREEIDKEMRQHL